MTRALPLAAGLAAALVIGAGAALAVEPVELFVDGTFSGLVGPSLPSTGAVIRTQRQLGRALGDFAAAQLGRKLPATDRERHDQAAATALWLTPGGTPVGWRNFRTRMRGEVTPEVGLFRNGDLVCRGYAEHIVLSPKDERRFTGVACWDASRSAWTASARTHDAP